MEVRTPILEANVFGFSIDLNSNDMEMTMPSYCVWCHSLYYRLHKGEFFIVLIENFIIHGLAKSRCI